MLVRPIQLLNLRYTVHNFIVNYMLFTCIQFLKYLLPMKLEAKGRGEYYEGQRILYDQRFVFPVMFFFFLWQTLPPGLV